MSDQEFTRSLPELVDVMARRLVAHERLSPEMRDIVNRERFVSVEDTADLFARALAGEFAPDSQCVDSGRLGGIASRDLRSRPGHGFSPGRPIEERETALNGRNGY